MKLINTRKDSINYLKPKERLVVAERTGFLQKFQMEKMQKLITLLDSEKLRVFASLSISKCLRILKVN